MNNTFSRRAALKNMTLGGLIPFIPISGIFMADNQTAETNLTQSDSPPKHYPNIDPEIVSEVVGKSHFNLERVKELVDKRPELARATWEWRFGDWESAIGAASHVGRRDIVKYLMENGARPTIFTHAMMGAYEVVKSTIEFYPGIQKTTGPHGISLLRHAKTGMRMKDSMTLKQQDTQKQLIEYLESLGNADGPTYLSITAEEQRKYLGDYKYGVSAEAGFTVQLNMLDMLALGPIGGFGGGIFKTDEDRFVYNGTSSVSIHFDVKNDRVQSLTIKDPDYSIKAMKIS